MACRMILTVGGIPMAKLLDDFILMAQNKNETHELNENDPAFSHENGWGMVMGTKDKIEIYKSESPCWKDPSISNFRYSEPDFVMLHARNASERTPINLESTQPFNETGWYFCHNGDVEDFLIGDKSDSRQLFTLLLEKMKQMSLEKAIKMVERGIKKYSALNFIITDGKKAYVLSKYQGFPRYFTMKYLVKDGLLAISSEVLPSFSGYWRKIPNDRILKLYFDGPKTTFELMSYS